MPDTSARDVSWRRDALALALVLLAAAGIRLISLPHEAVWHDEIATLEFLDAPNLADFLRQVHAVTPAPPLYPVTQYLWAQVFGTSVLSLRFLSMLYGLAGLAALYALGRTLLGHRAALIATAWMSLIFWHIYHSQEIRFYGMVTLLALLCVLTFLRFLSRPGVRSLALHAIVSGLMIWTQPQSVLLFGALGLYLVLFRARKWRVIVAWTLPHAALAASLVLFLGSIDREVAYAQAGWLSLPTLWRGYPSVRGFLAMGAGLMPFPPVNAAGGAMLGWRGFLWAAVEILTIAGICFAAWSLIRRRGASTGAIALSAREVGALVLLWFVVPPVFAYVGSYAWRPTFLGRYLAFSFPPLYLAAGYILQHRPRWLMVAAFLPLVLFDALYYFPGPMRVPYERIVDRIQAVDAVSRDIYVDDLIARSPIRYYWHGEPPEVLGTIEMEKAVDPFTETVQFNAEVNWLLLTDEKRARYMRSDLRRAEMEFEMVYYPSLRPAWLFYVPAKPLPELPNPLASRN
jgi:4-amino-4-deoxy-L-arabinose transferase-like glycosyltransferase